MHPQITRQLQRLDLQAETPPDAESWAQFLRLTAQAFQEYEQERMLLGRTSSESERLTRYNEDLTRQIAEERDKFQAMFASISDGLCAFDRTGKLTNSNDAALRYFGGDRLNEQMVFSRLQVRNPLQPEQWLQGDGWTQLIREGGELHDGNAVLLTIEKRKLPVHCTLNSITRGRQVIGAILAIRDISTQKRGEADLISAKEAAEQASRAKSDFLSSMSHELRTPMNAILGYSDILAEDLEDAPEGLDEDYLDDLKSYNTNIVQAGKHLLALINDVLDLTRIESGQIQINIGKMPLNEIVEECVAKIQPQLAEQSLTLDNQVAAGRAVTVFADRSRLSQVVEQLLSNAAKFNKPNGTITLSLDFPELNRVRLLVRDTGIGMNSEQQTKVFQPFLRMSGKNLSKGTGVGLTVAQQLLEVMDGKIGLESELDQGSTFWIELSLVHEEEAAKNEALFAKSRFLLLYIEDSRTNVSLVTKVLKARPDIALISAPTGELGVELARSHQPDFILLDINLPGIDGFEVLKRLNSFDETDKIPVVGLSADDSADAFTQAKAAGFYHYLVKPLDKKQFLGIINEVVRTDLNN